MYATPPSSGTYTIDIECSKLAYFYILDPASTTPIVNNTNCSGSSITTSLVSGRPYLIIYSGYTPSTATTGTAITVNIVKNS